MKTIFHILAPSLFAILSLFQLLFIGIALINGKSYKMYVIYLIVCITAFIYSTFKQHPKK